MTAPIVFLDTETTGLGLTDDIWEFAAIRRETDGTETEHHIFIDHDRKLCELLPLSFRDDHNERYRDHLAYSKSHAAQYILSVFRGAEKPHVVGAVPNFDTERIARLVAAHSPIRPNWHYHLIDVENLAVGYLAGRAVTGDIDAGLSLPDLPWDSNALSVAIGVDPEMFPRHTAMGDVLWAKAIYDAVMTEAVTGGAA